MCVQAGVSDQRCNWRWWSEVLGRWHAVDVGDRAFASVDDVGAVHSNYSISSWHLVVQDQNYAFARPSLTAKKQRALELRAGLPPRRGRKRSAAAYSLNG